MFRVFAVELFAYLFIQQGQQVDTFFCGDKSSQLFVCWKFAICFCGDQTGQFIVFQEVERSPAVLVET